MSEVDSFEKPKVQLEQVSTSPEIASRMIFTAANSFADIENCTVGDFGCGPGILSIASSLLEAATVVGFDIDESALETCWINLRKLEIDNVDLIHSDLHSISFATGVLLAIH